MLVTHGHADHSGNALPIASRTRTDLARDPRAAALAEQRLLGATTSSA